MRRLVFACALLVLSLPAAALAGRSALGDGTLVVKNATGVINIAARGSLIGSCDRCTIWITDPDAADGTGPIVTGEEREEELTATRSLYSGRDVRFRVIGGFSRTRVRGSGIELYAVGQGSVTVQGGLLNTPATGTYAVDGGERKQLPFEALTFQLGEKQPVGS